MRVDHLVERHGLGLQGPGVLTDLVEVRQHGSLSTAGGRAGL